MLANGIEHSYFLTAYLLHILFSEISLHVLRLFSNWIVHFLTVGF